MHHQTDIGRGG
ncbi:hypothetical protein VCHC51A1_1009, partial [Vibrio cholerae HC-51A1]